MLLQTGEGVLEQRCAVEAQDSRKRRRGRRRAALGEAAQGVDSYRHGAGKHQAERWSCFNEKMLL